MVANVNNGFGGLAVESRELDALRTQAQQDPEKALHKAAKQFEAVFMNMMLKSMREATPQDGMFDSEETKMFTSMLDQQLSQEVGGSRGIGLADMMIRQLGQNMAKPSEVAPRGSEVAPSVVTAPQVKNHAKALPSAYSEGVQQDFVRQMMPHALEVSRETGLPAHLMIGQAALESGWGKRSILNADGSNSHNLFGIKAGAGWKGKVVESRTTEYHNGIMSKPVEKFRSYDSFADSFRDYARLLLNEPRYARVIEQGDSVKGFAQALQSAGYATDPKYASKLQRVIGKINEIV